MIVEGGCLGEERDFSVPRSREVFSGDSARIAPPGAGVALPSLAVAARTGHRVVVVEGLCLPRCCCGCEASSSSSSASSSTSSSPTAAPAGGGAGPADETSCSARPSSLLCYLQQQQQQQPPCSNQCFMFRSRRSALVKRLWKHRRRPEQRQDEAGSSTEAAPSSSSSSSSSSTEDLELKATMHSFLKRLKDAQLQTLVAAVESEGADSTAGGCVLLPRGETVRLGRRSVQPYVLCCHIWRFPGLHGDSHNTTSYATNTYSDSSNVRLKPLPSCSSNYNHSNSSNNNNSCRGNNGNNTLSSLSSPGQQQHGGNNPSSTTTSSSTTSTTTLICCNPYHWSRVLEPGETLNVVKPCSH